MLDKIKEKLGGEARQYQYRCTRCAHRFESPYVKTKKVRCPECHSGTVEMVDNT